MSRLEAQSSDESKYVKTEWTTEVITQPATAVTKLHTFRRVEDIRTAITVKMLIALRRDGESGGFATFRVCRRDGVEYSRNEEVMLFLTQWYSQRDSMSVTDRLEFLKWALSVKQFFKEKGLDIESDGDSPEIDFSVELAEEKTRPAHR